MSEKTQQDQPAQDQPQQKQKMKLSTVLEKVERIAAGADAQNKLPGEEGHDPQTAPDKWTLWIAGVLRIHLRRSIEHVVEFRRGISALNEATKDLPSLREQVKEMHGLVREIVQAIEAARGQAGQAPPDAPPENMQAAPVPNDPLAPLTDEEPNSPDPLTPEQMMRRAERAQVNDLAAKTARENVVPMPAKKPNSGKSEPPAA